MKTTIKGGGMLKTTAEDQIDPKQRWCPEAERRLHREEDALLAKPVGLNSQWLRLVRRRLRVAKDSDDHEPLILPILDGIDEILKSDID